MPRVDDKLQMSGATAVIGEKYVRKKLSDDIQQRFNLQVYMISNMPIWLSHALGAVIGLIYPRMGLLLRSATRNTAELRQVYEKIEAYRLEFVDEWRRAGLDCVLWPPNVSPALPHRDMQRFETHIHLHGLVQLAGFSSRCCSCDKTY